MIKEFNKIIAYTDLKAKLQSAHELLFDKDFPFSSYFGINYKNGVIRSLKFYFVSFKKIKIEKLSTVFPLNPKTLAVYDKYQESSNFNLDNLGVTFAIKVNNEMKFSYSFYQKEITHILPDDNKLNVPIKEKSIRGNFFVNEFTHNKSFEKTYFLYSHPDNIIHILKEFRTLNDETKDVKFIEYAEFEGMQKMVMVFKNYKKLTDYLLKLNDPNLLEFNNYLKVKYGFLPDYPGMYLNGEERTIYYFDRKEGENFMNQSATIKKIFNGNDNFKFTIYKDIDRNIIR